MTRYQRQRDPRERMFHGDLSAVRARADHLTQD